MKRENFKSRLGFILISAGCAVGIGNVWKFPYVTGQNGGGIFVLFYFFFLIMVGVPVLTMEFAVGRGSRKSIVSFGCSGGGWGGCSPSRTQARDGHPRGCSGRPRRPRRRSSSRGRSRWACRISSTARLRCGHDRRPSAWCSSTACRRVACVGPCVTSLTKKPPLSQGPNADAL